MRIVIRCLYYKAVTSSCDIIDMDDATWKKFLYADGYKRKKIAMKLMNKEWLLDSVREIAWISLEDQDKLKEI